MLVAGNIDRSPLMALERAHIALPDGHVSIGWLYEQLDENAALLLLFVLAILGTLPGASLPVGLAICALALRMMFARGGIPTSIAMREIGTAPCRYALGRAITVMRACERVLPGASGAAMAGVRPFAGALLFVLGAMLLVPIPLSNVLPSLAAAAIALALIEGSVALFIASSLSAAGSLVLMAVTVSAATTFIGF